MKWQGKLTDTGQAVEVAAVGGTIASVRLLEPEETADGLPWLSPGWIDLQVNGYGGWDLNGERTTAEDVCGVTRALHARGVATYLPTVITGSLERMRQAVAAIAAVRRTRQPEGDSILGIHLEGPYLSGEDGCRGAHPPEHVRDPDWEEFLSLQDAADGLIRMVTLAPEREGAVPFIERLAEQGIVAAIGHTAADGEQIERAVRAGATLSTHLGNGTKPMLPRHPNMIWHQLAEDRLWAAFIPDGHHLAPPVLKAMLRAKRDKAIFVSDTTRFGGMAPGRYSSLIGGEVVLTPEGRLHTAADPRILAGSAGALDTGLAVAIRHTDMSLAEAVEAVTSRPAQALGDPSLGRIAPGLPAFLTLFEQDPGSGDLLVRETVVAGRSVYRRDG